MKYYRIFDDMYYPKKWYLDRVFREQYYDVDESALYHFVPENIEGINVEIHVDGEELDFTTLSTRSVPIVSEKFRRCFQGVDEIAFIPVNVVGKQCEFEHFIMIIQTSIDCVDEERSAFEKYEVNDPVRPDKAGKYSGFFELKLDYSKISNESFFRIDKASTYMVVSEAVKRKCEAAGLTGMKFTEV